MNEDSNDVIGAGLRDEDLVEPAPFDVVGDNIVVELVQREEETESGIVLVQEKQTRPPDVIVVGAGPLARLDGHAGAVDVEAGMVLIVRKHELVRLELGDDGRELFVLKPTAVLGVAR